MQNYSMLKVHEVSKISQTLLTTEGEPEIMVLCRS